MRGEHCFSTTQSHTRLLPPPRHPGLPSAPGTQPDEAPQQLPVTQQGATPTPLSRGPKQPLPQYQTGLSPGTQSIGEVCSIAHQGCKSLIVSNQDLPVLLRSPRGTCKLNTRCKLLTHIITHGLAATGQRAKSSRPAGEKFTCGTWKQATKTQTSPSPQRSHNVKLFLSDAPAASTGTFPHIRWAQPSLMQHQPFAKPSTSQGYEVWMGTHPSRFPAGLRR